jgi:hypothetical protein
VTQVTWNPAIRQEIEEDTLFLLDLADEEANWTPGNGGLVMNNSPAFDLLPWEDAGSKVSVVAGKFRDGLKPLDASNGFVTMPFFLPASEFTVEAWVKCDVGWSSLGATQYIATFGDRFSQYVHIWISATGTVTARLAHTQTTAGTTTTIGYAAGAFTAGTWHQVAVTLAGGTLTLYVDGGSRSAASSVPSPRAFGYTGRGDGLTIAGLGGEAATHTSVSDLRISRKARVPGVPVEVTAQNTITVGAATGDPINPLLPGGLHTLGGAPSEAALAGKLVVLRTDKAISATPIKAGGVDGPHPTLVAVGRLRFRAGVPERHHRLRHDRRGLPALRRDELPGADQVRGRLERAGGLGIRGVHHDPVQRAVRGHGARAEGRRSHDQGRRPGDRRGVGRSRPHLQPDHLLRREQCAAGFRVRPLLHRQRR